MCSFYILLEFCKNIEPIVHNQGFKTGAFIWTHCILKKLYVTHDTTWIECLCRRWAKTKSKNGWLSTSFYCVLGERSSQAWGDSWCCGPSETEDGVGGKLRRLGGTFLDIVDWYVYVINSWW